MTFEDNHDHYCIYCGEKLVPNQKFCSQCGREVYHDPAETFQPPSQYSQTVLLIEQEYDARQSKARQLVDKLFSGDPESYEKFSSAISKSNQLFSNQLDITKRMIELDSDGNELVRAEIENKIKTLRNFIDKMEDLINELVIHLSSNKKDDDDINNLFSDMDELIDSVKDY